MKFVSVVLGGAALAATIVGGAAAQSGNGAPAVLYSLMKDVVAVQAQTLWDVGNKAIDDNGNPDAKRLTKADWDTLAKAAQAMNAAATGLAGASEITVVPAGMKLQDEGAPGSSSPQQISQYIAADRAGFKSHAQALADVSSQFLAAAQKKDAAALMEVSGALDEVCESCHTKFWYPPQPGATQ